MWYGMMQCGAGWCGVMLFFSHTATFTAKFTATSIVRGRVLRCDVVMLRSAEGCGVL